MTKIFYDCEFLEDGKTIELISIGMVSDDGRKYYAINSDMPMDRIREHPWLMENVIPHLDMSSPDVKCKTLIAEEVTEFVLAKPDPQLWAWYGAYDHVVVCQLFGRMLDLPTGFPMWTNDIRQLKMMLGNPKLPEQATNEHNALNDAEWNESTYNWLKKYYYDNRLSA